ncbi:Hypothetical protein PHPALM_18392 [Phytophthora palmivora]|uniref:DUF7869 domain-containing protein n=1 Tax=Phytophthora palmivora TaxID=4796 RepID=A0A2P4XJW8_9STRA|nr:Hypothetical protein PHPALM_18392 [Phytophthora palmivora]
MMQAERKMSTSLTTVMMRTGAAEADDVVTGESAGSEAEEEDISINLYDVDLQQQVAGLISADKCKRRCLEGKAKELEWLTCSLGQMTKAEKPTCILTLIGILMQTDTASRRRGTGKREKFHFFLPREYKKDKGDVHEKGDISKDLAVIVMDFSQNLTNEGTQTNYVYDEFASGKGSDQINSMLQHFIRTVLLPAGKKRLIVYADNCSGQNKNNHVIKFLLAQVHMGVFERVDYKWPDNEPVVQDLRRKVDGRLTELEKVTRMFAHFLEDLSPPPRNTEKMLKLHSKIGPYVPEEH